MKNAIIEAFEKEQLRDDLEINFNVGDIVIVFVRIIEGKKQRLQAFEGLVIAKKNRGLNSSFIVRKNSHGVWIERTFMTHSKMISKIEIKRQGKVRKAKLYYIRNKTGKDARIKEKIN